MPWRTAQVIDVHRFVKMSLFWLWIVVKVLSYYIYNMGFDQHISKKKHLTKAKPPRISDQGFLVKYGYDSIQQKTDVRLLATRDTLKVTTSFWTEKFVSPGKNWRKSRYQQQCYVGADVHCKRCSLSKKHRPLAWSWKRLKLLGAPFIGGSAWSIHVATRMTCTVGKTHSYCYASSGLCLFEMTNLQE